MAHTTAAEVAAFAAALPAVSGRSHHFCVLRRSDVSDPQRIALAFCGVRCAELYVMLANERYYAEEGICLSVFSIPFQRQRRVILQKSRRRTGHLLRRKEQAAVCGANLSGLFTGQYSCHRAQKSISAAAPARWPWRKLNPCLSIAWNRQTEPLSFLKLLSTCFR